MTDNSPDNNTVLIEQLRWLIDQKLGFFKSFESRSMQILGFNGLFLTVIWTNLPKEPPLSSWEQFLLIIYSLLFIIQFILTIFVTIPRTGKFSLEIKPKLQDTIENMKSYLEEKNDQLKLRAKFTTTIYLIFPFQIFIFILLILLRLFLLQ